MMHVLGCSVIGVSHERSGQLCQDSSSYYEGGTYTIIAVADGHGDRSHDLSETGARLAVHSATDILKKLADDVAAQKDILLSRMIRNDFPRLVVRKWREMVRDDFRNRTIAAEEGIAVQEETIPYSRYGTTLMAAIATETNVIYAQIGDGDIVLLREDGSYEMLSPNDQNLVGGATLSLSGREAAMRFSCGNSSAVGMRGLFLSTDGLRNCYEEDAAFIRLLTAVAAMVIKEGIALTTNILREQFVQFSKNGSGDDITLTAAISTLSSEEKTLVSIKDINIENITDSTGEALNDTNHGN
jgi:serine/threonine protein phosphatase PrpC